MPKVTPKKQGERETVHVKTQPSKPGNTPSDWWNSNDKAELAQKLLGTVGYLKQQNGYRYKQASIYARLYGNMPLMGVAGSSINRISAGPTLPSDRPTMSVITSCTDTIVSRLSQSRPQPVFLTDFSDYKLRQLAKQLNQFIVGELYQTKAYELMPLMLRDACVLGTGVIKILEDMEKKVALERRLCTELLVDSNDAFYGVPRMIYELKLMDRQLLLNDERLSKGREKIEGAESGSPDGSADSSKSVADQIIVAEAFRLPSHPKANDGLHVIACSEGVIFDEEWKKKFFPYEFLHYSPRMVGMWGQSLAERQMGTQMGINQLLMTTHKSINLVGVPRVFVEKGSKVVKAHLNNEIGAIVEYSGTKPQYEVAPCVPVEIYSQLERLIKYAYNQEGVSELAAVGQKPAGINSGQAQREYDDIQSDRFAALNKRYDNVAVALAYQIIDRAKDIAVRDGSYQTVFPDKEGAWSVDLPKAKILDNPFVIQCFDMSSLPRDPAGRAQAIIERMQAGLYSPQEARRLMGSPDTEQEDRLLNAGEERILKILDEIVEEGKYTPPDQFMDPQLATQLCTQYYNLFMAKNLEEDKAQMLRDFFTQVGAITQAGQPPMPPMPGGPAVPGITPQADPMAPPQSDMIPNVPGAA